MIEYMSNAISIVTFPDVPLKTLRNIIKSKAMEKLSLKVGLKNVFRSKKRYHGENMRWMIMIGSKVTVRMKL